MNDTRRFKPGDVIVPGSKKYPDGALHVVSHDADALKAYPMGGGFEYSFDVERQRGHAFRVVTEEEMKASPWVASWFCLDESPVWQGYHTGQRWNGWAMPAFEKAEGLSIIQFLKGSNDVAEYREASDSFFVRFDNEDEDDPGDEAKGFDITLPEGRTVHVYGIGDGFTWSEVKPTDCEACGTPLPNDWCCPECGLSHAGDPCQKCHRFGSHADDCDEPPGMHTEGGPKYVPNPYHVPTHEARKEEIDELVDAFQCRYAIYEGWHFEFMYPGFFSYSPAGGDILVCFTSDWSERGKVDIQVQSTDGDCFEDHGGEAEFFADRSAGALFRIVKPYLDKLSGKTASDLRK